MNRYNGAFLSLIEATSVRPTVAVKDIFDVAGSRTTAGSEYLARTAEVADADAPCVSGFRGADIAIFGKSNLNELAFGTTGINSWSGTPRNPLGADLIPGGSSSGNAVALSLGICRYAIGTDTGGSVRIPSACCGTVGLKPTLGSISTRGVRPLAPSFDVVGPMTRTVRDLSEAWRFLHPPSGLSTAQPARIYRLRVGAVATAVNTAIGAALEAARLETQDAPIVEEEWESAIVAANDILWAEAAVSNRGLVDHWGELQVGDNLERGLAIHHDRTRMHAAHQTRQRWGERLRELIGTDALIVSPTLECLPPTFTYFDRQKPRLARFTIPVNLAGLPALCLPIPSDAGKPASLQLIGPPHAEAVLIRVGCRIEASLEANSGRRT
jgi:amidase